VLRPKNLEPYLEKKVLVIYNDCGHICRVKGVLKSVSEDSITIDSWFNVLVISGDQIIKVKIPKTDVLGENSEK